MLEYHKLGPQDEDIVIQYVEKYLNAGPYIRDHIHEGLLLDTYIGFKCVDSDTGEVAGMVASRPGIEFTYPHPDLEVMVSEKLGHKPVYTGDLFVVRPKYRKEGIGRHLTVLMVEELKKRNVSFLMLEMWIRYIEGDVPALHPTLNACQDYELKTLAVVNDFYKDLADYGMTCPECGSNCKCGAMITALTLDEPAGEVNRLENKED